MPGYIENVYLRQPFRVVDYELHNLILLDVIPETISACHNQVASLDRQLVDASIVSGVCGIGVVRVGSKLQGAIKKMLQGWWSKGCTSVPDDEEARITLHKGNPES